MYFLFFLLSFKNAYAFETDNFNCRYADLQDVTQQLNVETNRRIAEALDKGAIQLPPRPAPKLVKKTESNRTAEPATPNSTTITTPPVELPAPTYRPLVGCDRTELHAALRGALAPAWMGNLEHWAQDQSFSKCLPENHIYSGTKSGMVLMGAGINYTIKVGGVNIGADKLSHFMTEGADYYEKQMSGGNLREILQIGENEENGKYGLISTGVKSYGDLAANYQGYQFWKKTTEGSDPYFKCINNKWVQVKQFDWSHFVNPMMDESINCSKYSSEEFAAGVAKNVEALQKSKNASPLTCPLDVVSCKNVEQFIPNQEARNAIIHPDCLNIQPTTIRNEGINETIK